MNIISSIIRKPAPLEQTLGFSVWARGEPKIYLESYPKVATTIALEHKVEKMKLVAVVDDVLPRIYLGRTQSDQSRISDLYKNQLPAVGFDQVHLVSSFVPEDALWGYLKFSSSFTSMQFMKILPRSKHEKGELRLSEIVGFLWHLWVMELSMEQLGITGFLAGIRSEFFYLAARQVLKPHDVYFLGGSD